MQLLCQEEWQIVARQNDTFPSATNASKLSPTLNALLSRKSKLLPSSYAASGRIFF